MSAPWTIRKATVADAVDMAACVNAAYEHYVARMQQTPGPMLDDYAIAAQHPGAFVAVQDGSVVGILVLIEDPERMLLDNIAVYPRAQVTGLGRALLMHADAHTLARGYSELWLYTHEQMHENIEMYSRAGFIETHRLNEKGFARVYMCKRLNDQQPQDGQ
jgi:N-acetylglutamate synthase-like GNAT family acetyltransferase